MTAVTAFKKNEACRKVYYICQYCSDDKAVPLIKGLHNNAQFPPDTPLLRPPKICRSLAIMGQYWTEVVVIRLHVLVFRPIETTAFYGQK